MNQKAMFAIVLPILSAACIAIYAGGLGIIFMAIFGDPRHENHSKSAEWGVVILGIIITVLVPVVAFLLQRRTDQA